MRKWFRKDLAFKAATKIDSTNVDPATVIDQAIEDGAAELQDRVAGALGRLWSAYGHKGPARSEIRLAIGILDPDNMPAEDPKPTTFMEAALVDKYKDPEALALVAHWISEWHRSGVEETRTLCEYLGMTEEEFYLFVIKPNQLESIIAARKQHEKEKL